MHNRSTKISIFVSSHDILVLVLRTPLVIPCLNHSHSNIQHYSSIMLAPNHERSVHIPSLSVTLSNILDAAYANLSSFLFIPYTPFAYTTHIISHACTASYTIVPQLNAIFMPLHDILLLVTTKSARHSCLNYTHIPTIPHTSYTLLHCIMHNRYTNHQYLHIIARYPYFR